MKKGKSMKKKVVIGVPEIRAAMEELKRYRRGREAFNRRVLDEENWYRLRVSPKAHRNAEGESFAPRSAWLFNSLLQKHADLMEHMPGATCLAREESDEQEAKALSRILPVILERGNFGEAYSDNMWFKLKHGVCAWGVFWNNALENGLGDIDVRRVDLLNLYWQPGVRDLQDSRSVYFVEEVDDQWLRARYPQYNGGGASEEFVSVTGGEQNGPEKALVVDWYYKKLLPNGTSVLHYCKFSGDTVLFSTENDPAFGMGWYEHGQYPFVLDVLYPIEGEALGFGVIAVARDPQTYIDRMDRNLLEYMDWATRVRYFCKKNIGMNEEEFGDLSRRVVEVEGDLGEDRLRQITVAGLDSLWLQLKGDKVTELKETTANRNVSQGSADGGVTAAAAIAALQEAGNKTMRDMISASFRAFVRTVRLVVECVRQFYSEARCFRILGPDGYTYLHYSNQNIREHVVSYLPDGTPLSRRPIFDIDVRAEKQDPYARLSYNETLKDLYRMGVFDPANAKAALVLLDGMDFPGVARIRAEVAANAAAGGERKGVTPKDVPSTTPQGTAEMARHLSAALAEKAAEDAH